MDAVNNSIFSTVCDEIITTTKSKQCKVTSTNFINALAINVRNNDPLLEVGCTPFQMLIDEEKVQVSCLHAYAGNK